MLKRRGFTLIELITVLVVLAVILAIAGPTVTSIINTSYLKTYELDLAALEKAGRDYVTKGHIKLAENDLKIVTLHELVIKNLTEEVRDPRTKEICDGYVSITKTGDVTVYKAKIRCGDYETEGYGSEDPDAPVITILGNNPHEIQRGVSYTDAGATAIDNVDGDVTASIIVTGSVNTNEFGAYEIVYTVKDKIGNIGTATRIVNVIDDVPPEITFSMNGNNSYARNRSTTINVTDDSPLEASGLKYVWTTAENQPSIESFVNTYTNGQTVTTPAGVTGDYYLWALAIDDAGNEQYTRTNVFKLDNTPPVITMNGEAEVVIARGSTYVDAGATATDNIDGAVSVNISGTVSANIIGEYQVTYTATDSRGNSASPVIRTVVVRDMTAPEIIILGNNPHSLNVGGTYTDAGATATDDIDGNLTNNIQITSDVDVNIAGTYTVTYTVSDSSNNVTTRTRTVTVIQPYSCSIGTLVNHATYGYVCTVTAASQNWYSSGFVCTQTGQQPITEACCTYTCEQSCYAGWAACGYCEGFQIDGCLGACWIGGCISWGTCVVGYQTVCVDGYYYASYYCNSGWSTYSGSDSNLVCYRAATQG